MQREIMDDDQLWEVVKSCFSNIDITIVQSLLRNMPNRIESILDNGGDHIKS